MPGDDTLSKRAAPPTVPRDHDGADDFDLAQGEHYLSADCARLRLR